MEKTLKQTVSSPFFRSTRVVTCQYVVTKSGQTRAICFPQKKTGWKAPNSWNNQRRSSETTSVASNNYRTVPQCHTGMHKKPLCPYDPTSYRSRLPIPDLVMPYKNASTVEIGNRTAVSAKSQFRTTYSANMTGFNFYEYASNQGIVSEKTKWKKLRTQD